MPQCFIDNLKIKECFVVSGYSFGLAAPSRIIGNAASSFLLGPDARSVSSLKMFAGLKLGGIERGGNSLKSPRT